MKRERLELLRSVLKYGLPMQPSEVAGAAANVEATPPHLASGSDAAAAVAAAAAASFCESTRQRCPILALKGDASLLRALADLIAEMCMVRGQSGEPTLRGVGGEWRAISTPRGAGGRGGAMAGVGMAAQAPTWGLGLGARHGSHGLGLGAGSAQIQVQIQIRIKTG